LYKKLKKIRRFENLEKKLKKKKFHEPSSSSSSDGETNASSDEDKEFAKKKSYNSISFNYESLPSNNVGFVSMPICKPPHFDGMNYTKWSHNMKMHLISLNPSVWKVFCTGIEFLKEDESPTYEQLQ
jgi:hypothetical protein